MTGWKKTRADRARDQAVYGSREYQAARAAARRRAAGRCEQCGHRHPLECDHIVPVAQGGTHSIANLQMLCKGAGTCKCHERKTASESKGGIAADPLPRPRTAW